eukprot:gb/GEZJ01002919.1/.p1 GENE.gb/GEZJ01002919.1/~~gb/GEZJ01002919.1/.p1  ORF type:complete len:132 (-),score=14.47 gb/GEZJ01002919.1/:856-1251(-)
MTSKDKEEPKVQQDPSPGSQTNPVKFGNIGQISREYGTLHITAPASPSSPRGNVASASPKSWKEWLNPPFKKRSSTLPNSSEDPSPSARDDGNGDNAARRSSTPISRTFRAMKQGVTRVFTRARLQRDDNH